MLRNLYLPQDCKDFSLMLSSGRFILLIFTFWTMNHLCNFYKWCFLGKWKFFFPLKSSVVPISLVKKSILSLSYLRNCQNHCPYMCEFFPNSLFCSFDLSIFIPLPHCFGLYCFIVSVDIWWYRSSNIVLFSKVFYLF